ncbi:cyclo(L-leucyl-L-leucyl) synthase [Kutzneria viridogrisea]|uniref:Cyclodipeptide synthase n=2 Tax=Kutzneria TaxID=43356 RepID=W5WI04_9PSEU|nr:hypothetical protein KALB_7471 [Kutzneria albida DSM 43870]MBA8926106.1 cyclo(L-tyrosyl-L-tyrosyl) synthase [Kutzneria viridogrisea]
MCLGVSPFNSYFTAERLLELVTWANRCFREFHVFLPDEPAAHTLEALGYPIERARHKARRQANYMRNKICRALSDAGVDDPLSRVLDSEALRGNEAYQSLHGTAEFLFHDDDQFRAACLEATNWVLDRKLPDGARPTPDQLLCAVRYFLAELPLFAGTTLIVDRPSSAFVYHQRVWFLERFYRGELTMRPEPGQGFLVVEEAEEAESLAVR